MNYIIALKGKGSTGKTTTHGIFRKNLLNKGYTLVAFTPVSGKLFSIDGEDFIEILEKNNFKIGICSAGDFSDNLDGSLKELIQNGCTRIFASCRTNGETIDVVEDFYGFTLISNDYIPIYKMKLDANKNNGIATEAQCNKTDADALFEICEQLIK